MLRANEEREERERERGMVKNETIEQKELEDGGGGDTEEIREGRGKMTRVANINNGEERRGEESRYEAIEGGN